jgi:hypothetical protein
MDAAIGTAAALNIHDYVAENPLGTFQQIALNGPGIILFLPSAKIRAVVFKGKLVTSGYCFSGHSALFPLLVSMVLLSAPVGK